MTVSSVNSIFRLRLGDFVLDFGRVIKEADTESEQEDLLEELFPEMDVEPRRVK